jgi:hypothetical protein
MLKAAISKLSYANVMSSLAVFLALGGTAVAVTQINGSRLVNESVAGKKLKVDTVTGKRVKESTFGQVPSAATADNALALGGLAPSEYERATTVLDGQGQSNSTNPQAIFNSLNTGFTLTTDGDSDTNTQLLLQNNNASGNLIGTPYTKAGEGAAFGVLHGTSAQIGPASGNGTDFLDTLITDAGSPSKSVWLHCLFNVSNNVPTVFCWGIQT